MRLRDGWRRSTRGAAPCRTFALRRTSREGTPHDLQSAARVSRREACHPRLLSLVQLPAAMAEFRVGQHALVVGLRVLCVLPARVTGVRNEIPFLGGAVDPEQQLDRTVGGHWCVTETMMRRRYACTLNA